MIVDCCNLHGLPLASGLRYSEQDSLYVIYRIALQADADSQRSDVLGRITYSTDRGALADCDLIIEAITENPKIKLPLYKELGEMTKQSCILASNTSSLAIGDMAKPSGRPDRVVGLHFFNPVQVMKLVEVVRTDATDPAVFEACKAWVTTLGKHPVSCKDTPGFIVNRLLVPSLAQAMLMLDRGDASIEDIDKSMELGKCDCCQLSIEDHACYHGLMLMTRLLICMILLQVLVTPWGR